MYSPQYSYQSECLLQGADIERVLVALRCSGIKDSTHTNLLRTGVASISHLVFSVAAKITFHSVTAARMRFRAMRAGIMGVNTATDGRPRSSIALHTTHLCDKLPLLVVLRCPRITVILAVSVLLQCGEVCPIEGGIDLYCTDQPCFGKNTRPPPVACRLASPTRTPSRSRSPN